MEIRKNISYPKKGMQRDKHPSEVTEQEYTFSLNSNIQDEHGNGPVFLQNEPSNIKCSGFLSGYIVVGHKYDISTDNVYFFLNNPTTGCSEIGVIKEVANFDSLEAVETACGCNIKVELETPLEDTTQTGYCTYETIISDCCAEFTDTKCLDFDIAYPIKETNVHIKNETSGKYLYFTDFKNPQRKVNLSNTDQYYEIDNVCDDPTPACLQCEKMRIFPLFDKPCLEADVIQFGGNLKAGVYQVFAAYSTITGVERSDYYSPTNPISIWDENQIVLDQTNLDYQTNLAISINVSDLDQDFDYYKVVVVYRSGLDTATSYKVVGVYPTTTNKITINSLTDADDLITGGQNTGGSSLSSLLRRSPMYTNAKGMAEANNQLFQYGLKTQRELNLQPVVNLMGAFAKWNTVQAKESLYKDGVAVSKYRGYMRDETYPFGIKFYMKGGFETATFPFIPRPATGTEKDVVVDGEGNSIEGDLNVESILDSVADCQDIGRDERWQFENTATIDGELCVVPSPSSTESVDRTEQFECTVRDGEGEPSVVDTIGPDQVCVDIVSGIVSYINNNLEEIKISTDPELAAIKAVLNGVYPEECTPESGANCGALSLVDEQIFAIEATNEETEIVYDVFADYTRVLPPTFCENLEIDTSTGNPVEDTTFRDAYHDPADTVYSRQPAPSNISCGSAVSPVSYSGLATPVFYFLQNEGEVAGFSSLLTSFDADPSSPVFPTTNPGFADKVHTNALWFKVDFNGRERVIVELSTIVCTTPDDNTGNQLRVTVFPDCSSTNISSYTSVISDVTLSNDPNKFIELDSSDFGGTSGTAYIAIDSEIFTEFVAAGISDDVYRLRPPCGCFTIYERDAQGTSCINFDTLTFGKKQIYEATCSYAIPVLTDCDPIPYQKGLFSYWESSEKYPCNPELFNSQDALPNIEIADIPVEYQTDFETYYADISGTDYVLRSDADFQDKPIRHYKFPCGTTVPFMGVKTENPGDFKETVIYPIGFSIDNEIINTFLDIAVKNELITVSERLSIEKYEIVRGDRRTDRSVIAKGLLFDVYPYIESSESFTTGYYSNYPLNSLGDDVYNERYAVGPGNLSNDKYTFHSPDIHFYKPTLPNEMKVEGYVYGKSSQFFDEVDGHPRYVLLGDDAYAVAATLAGLEVAFDVLLQTGNWMIEATANDLFASIPGIIAAAAFVVSLGLTAGFNAGQLTQQWIDIFRNTGRPKQFAYYQSCMGYYNWFTPNSETDSLLRGVPTRQYIKDGRWNVTNEASAVEAFKINNLDREDTAFLYLGDAYPINYPTEYFSYDNTVLNPLNASRMNPTYSYDGVGRSGRIVKHAASPYVSLKQYIANQYGGITDIEWLPTGYCGNLNDNLDCDPIFGGDIFISRFSVKRKFPFFDTNAFDLADLTPYKYSDYFNLNPDSPNTFRTYVDYLTNDEDNSGAVAFPITRSDYLLDNQPTNAVFYQEPPSKFYLFSYGIPYFLVESEFNCNYRYAKNQSNAQDFYPNVGDIIDWTQEKNVSIREPNYYYYNPVYSYSSIKTAWRNLPLDFEQDFYDKLSFLENSVTYSEKDISETSTVDPWSVYKPLNFYQFPTQYGTLIDMDGIESEQILGRFENGFTIFGAIDQIADRFTPETGSLGTGGIFAGRNVNFNETDLGYAGTQHTAKVSCKYGHFWVDSMRGKVFQLEPNGQGLKEITFGLEKWFKDQLPFKMKKYFPDLTLSELDNSRRGLGITMGWDDRLNRVFITKLDYIPKEGFNIEFSETQGFYITGAEEEIINIDLTDDTYFTNCSWTVAYSPMLQSWISYYSFLPNYYVSYNNYFQTGINENVNTSPDSSIWSHLPYISSHQVFYGTLYPWIIEYVQKSQLTNSVLNSVEYWLDVRKYYNKYDHTDIYGIGFNKAVIYNSYQNSGQLNLVHQKENNLYQQSQYPKHNSDTIDILQSEINGKWSFNYFYNLIRSEKSGLPIWLSDCANIGKTLNNKLLDYRNNYKDRLRGDYFNVRLEQDIESRYKMIYRFSTDNKGYYEQ